jgi:hypothetical protein
VLLVRESERLGDPADRTRGFAHKQLRTAVPSRLLLQLAKPEVDQSASSRAST